MRRFGLQSDTPATTRGHTEEQVLLRKIEEWDDTSVVDLLGPGRLSCSPACVGAGHLDQKVLGMPDKA